MFGFGALLTLLVTLLVLLVMFSVGIYRKIKKIEDPSHVVMGANINTLCPVRFEEAMGDIERQDDGLTWRGKRRTRRNYFQANYAHFCSEVKNATVFHGVLSYEKGKVDETKSGLDYSPREAMIEMVLGDAAKLRWQQARWKRSLRLRGMLRLKIDKKMLETGLVHYKKLEADMITLSTMGNGWYVNMLKERLGLLALEIVEDDEYGTEA
jgi:hypothetical protein